MPDVALVDIAPIETEIRRLLQAPDLRDPQVLLDLRRHVRDHVHLTRDPETLPCLSTEPHPPDGPDFHTIIGSTSKRPGRVAPKRYRCPFCNVDEKFWDGRILVGADRKLRLIGNHCADGHVEDWRGKEAEYTQRRLRDRDTWLRQELIPAIGAAESALDLVQRPPASKPWAAVARLGIAFAQGAEDLHRGLVKSIERHGYTLNIYSEAGSALSRKKRVLDVSYRVLGAQFLRSPKPLFTLRDSRTLLTKAARAAAETRWEKLTDQQFNTKLDNLIGTVRLALEKAAEATVEIEAAAAFMSPGNLVHLVEWASHPQNNLSRLGTYEALPSGLIVKPMDADDVVLQLPRGFAVPQITAVVALRRVVDRA